MVVVCPLVKFTHNPGHEDTPDDASYVQETGHPAYRADDALWLFPTVYKYVSETGNVDFIDEVIPFANKDEGTVYEHLKRAIQFSMEHLGKTWNAGGTLCRLERLPEAWKRWRIYFCSFAVLLCNDHFEGVCGLRKKMKNISHIWKKARKSLGN